MYIKEEYNFNDLLDKCWSGAIDTLKEVEKYDKEEELMNLIQECFGYECDSKYDIPTLTEVNDFLWFEDKFIFDNLGITEESEEEEE